MPDLYEVRIRGPIGPLTQACLPGFSVVTAAEHTVLTGTTLGPDQLQHLLDLLSDNGLDARDVRLTNDKDAATTAADSFNED